MFIYWIIFLVVMIDLNNKIIQVSSFLVRINLQLGFQKREKVICTMIDLPAISLTSVNRQLWSFRRR